MEPEPFALGEHLVNASGKFILTRILIAQVTGASNDRFLSNAFKCCFRLSRVPLKLCRLILGFAKKFICSVILGELEYD